MKLSSTNIIDGILNENFGANAIDSYKKNNIPVVNFDLEWQLYNQNSHYLHILFIDYDAIPVCGMPWIHWTVANIDLYKNSKININDCFNNKDLIQGQNTLAHYDPDHINKNFYNSYVGPMPPDKDHVYTVFAWTTFDEIPLTTGFTYNELYKHLTDENIIEQGKLDFIYKKDKIIKPETETISNDNENIVDDINFVDDLNLDKTSSQKTNKKIDYKSKLKNLFLNPNFLYNALFASLFISTIWLMLILIFPISYSYDGLGYITNIYFKYNNYLTLSPIGIATIFFFFVFLLLDITILVFIIKNKFNKYENKKYNISYYTGLIALCCIWFIGFLILYIPAFNLIPTSDVYVPYFKSYNGCLSYNGTWYFFIVLFSLLIAYNLINLLICNKLAKNNNFNFKEFIKDKKEFFHNVYQQIKQNKNKRKLNNHKKKRLLEEEEKLLNNLNEIDLSTNQSDEVLENNIKLNQDIKNRIMEIQEKKDKINKENPSIFTRKKKNFSIMNKRDNRVRKQKIAVPDKELEDIFKNLEIDD